VSVSNNSFNADERIVNLTGGGGGWGNPLERLIPAVVEDVRQGFVSATKAKDDYGVVIDPKTLVVDEAATAKLRGVAGVK